MRIRSNSLAPRTRLAVAIAFAAGLSAGCDVHTPTAPGTLASITVTPNVTLAINATQQFVAVGKDAAGVVVAISPVWSIVAGGGGIGTGGLFTAGTVPGVYTATVKATSGGMSGTATVTVIVGPLATITVTPDPVTLPINGTQQYTAVGRDAGGNVVTIAPTWSVVAGGGAITATALFTAGTVPGTYAGTVRAAVGALSGTATVNVVAGALATIVVTPNPVTLPVGGTQQYTAVGKDAAGNVVTITPVWSVAAGGGAINGTGLFTAGTVLGTFPNTVTATSGGIAGTATVTVVAGAVQTITVTPNPATLPFNGVQQFVAVGTDAGGNVVAITPVWSVVANGGTINSTGLFTAGAVAGTFANTVKATSGTVSGTATVIVTGGPLATITVTPNPASLAVNGTQQFVAVGRDAGGNVVPITPVWSVVAGGGTINSAGLFTAGNTPGSFPNTVRAASGAIAGTATVNVVGPVITIDVEPNPATVLVNGTQQFIAIGRDAAGNVVPISPVWSVVAGGGTISATGLFTAGAVAGTFTGTVRAASGSSSGVATVIVTSVAPLPPLVPLGAAGTHGVLAGSTFTCVDLGIVSADVSVWPGSAITGFPPCLITGARHSADAFAQTAQGALTTAYNQLDGMPCNSTLTADLGGQTLQPGVHCSLSSQGLTGEMFFDGLGDPNASFVVKAATTLTTAGARVTLLNGAQAKNIYWLVGSSATIGVGSAMKGNIITFTTITLNDNATLLGRALARNGAVTMGTNNVITLP